MKKARRIRLQSQSHLHKIRVVARLRVAVWVILLNVLFVPQFVSYEEEQDNFFIVSMNGVEIGKINDTSKIYELYKEARLSLADNDEKILFTKTPIFKYTGQSANFGRTDSDKTIIANIANELENTIDTSLTHAYAIKVGDEIVNVGSSAEVLDVLQGAIDRYDAKGRFAVELSMDESRELNVLTASINQIADEVIEEVLPVSGAEENFKLSDLDISISENVSFDSFELGVNDIHFGEKVEITDAYIGASRIADADTCRKLLTENQETEQIYKVQRGDTLSEISLVVGLPVDEIVKLNDALENENTGIFENQELLITVPKPKLTVIWTENAKVEESYELPIEYIYNDSWYTNHEKVTHVQPSAGFHEAVVEITHENDSEIEKNTLYEVVIEDAVAKIVEVGTIEPPTFIKPINGGRVSSSFGSRSAPTKGASTYHKGVDFATPIGTSVYASSGGTVSFAGWGSGYGYVVYIDHPNGMQTRYGHLSKISCQVGEKVSQGEIIAQSGNTGRSTGPHVHFEVRVNGTPVNPFDYL